MAATEQAKPEREFDLRKLSIIAGVAAIAVIVAAFGLLLSTNRLPELQPSNDQYVTLQVVDKIVDDGTTLCVVEYNGKLRSVYGGSGLSDFPCPIAIGGDIPVVVSDNIKDGVNAYSLTFDNLGYLWGPDVKRD